METKDLPKTWTGPDNSRLMRHQTSMRLSVHVAAKIQALCDMFPHRTKTQIINDLLATALDQLRASLEVTHPWEETEEGLENLPTQQSEYDSLVEKYLRVIDRESSQKTSETEDAVSRRRTKQL